MTSALPRQPSLPLYDLAIVGGGINGAGIAADAAARGLSVFLCEQGDFAGATSSASSKLVHGGLRYLEHYEFRLVREALAEREVLLRIAPHLVSPQRFVLPHAPHLRAAWMIRAGLFLYDHLGRRVTLPGSRRVDVRGDAALRELLADGIDTGFEYSDCMVDDARLVIANLLQARQHGATLHNRTRCARAAVVDGHWQLHLEGRHAGTVRARTLVNAAGPWAQQFLEEQVRVASPRRIRLVQGSHIVLPRVTEDARALIVQNADRRVVFVLPWQGHTVVGTTDREYDGDPREVHATDTEIDYLLDVANRTLRRQHTRADIVSSWSGVRPLCDDESGDPAAVTRDYTLSLQEHAGCALLTVFGGKLTTYRRLALAALRQLAPHLPAMAPSRSHALALPGGDLDGLAPKDWAGAVLQRRHPWLPEALARRWAQAYGSRALGLLEGCRSLADLGADLGGGLHEREVRFLRDTEWACTAEDVLDRRTRLGLVLDAAARNRVAACLAGDTGGQPVPVIANGRAEKSRLAPACG
jgi:glycerol-3-phosphate dehydrogenase